MFGFQHGLREIDVFLVILLTVCGVLLVGEVRLLFVLLHVPLFLPVLHFRLRRVLRQWRLLSACPLDVLRVRLYLRPCLRLWRLLLRRPYSWLLRMLCVWLLRSLRCRLCLSRHRCLWRTGMWLLRCRLLRTLRLRISLFRSLRVCRLLNMLLWNRLLLLYRRCRLRLLFHQTEV